MGLDYGQKHIERIFLALQSGDIQVLHLTDAERTLIANLPAKLHAGEREGIALCQTRSHLFLSNDRRAIRYCQAHDIDALSLEILLRFLWTRQIVSLSDVRALIEAMAVVENLTLSQRQRAIIFAPHTSGS
jgi:predicted nucleic acid-binding protein